MKVCAATLAPILTHVICLCFETKRFPQKWKIANIVPIPKIRNPTVKDIRPISLLPIFGKICEKAILSSVKDDLIDLYGQDQYGFRPSCSTTISHIRLHDFITAQMDEKSVSSVLLISFDMSKAFDTLNHAALLRTLMNTNLPSGFIQWCSDYLQHRKQKVIIETESSSLTNVTSGVPQGSVISPFLFCLHMNSVKASTPKALTLKYADDVLIAIPICDDDQISSIINSEIDNMAQWCDEHGLKLNAEKTKTMVIAKRHNQPVHHSGESNEMKVLGLTYNAKCTWKSHIDIASRDASRRIYVLRQLKPYLTKPLLIQVYGALIRSSLEYCNAAFVGLSAGDAEQLEKVQRRCHRIICGSHCQCTSFTPLHERRTQHAMNIFRNISNPQHILHDLYPPILPHGKRLMLQHTKTNRRLSSFIPFCTRIFNGVGL